MPEPRFFLRPTLKNAALLGIVVALGATAWIVWQSSLPVEITPAEGFNVEPVLESHFVNDIGIADIDGDGDDDIFAMNHSAGGSILLNDGRGYFGANALSELALDQQRDLPGFHAQQRAGVPEGAGVFISYVATGLLFDYREAEDAKVLRLSLHLPWRAALITDGDVTATRSSGDDSTSLELELGPGGRAFVEPQPPPSDGFPISVRLPTELPLDQVRIGPKRVHPPSHGFEFRLKDRHGMAWLDVNADGIADPYISRGGARGRMASVDPEANDQWYISHRGRFADRAGERGVAKQGCPGQQVQWIDADADGGLELYLVCGRHRGEGAEDVNQHYALVRSPEPRLRKLQPRPALAPVGTALWVQLMGDRRPELLYSTRSSIRLYRADGDYPDPVELASQPRRLRAGSGVLRPADRDNDGDADVAVISTTRNWLLNNNGDRIEAIPAEDLGLPDTSLTGSWTDFNGDGLLDLHLLPQGVFLQQADGRFRSTGDLGIAPQSNANNARLTWFDADGDGDLDALMAFEVCLPGILCEAHRRALKVVKRALASVLSIDTYLHFAAAKQWHVMLARNTRGRPRVQRLDLRAIGNPVGVGARVRVQSGPLVRLLTVGEAEGSHYSHGHYSLYVATPNGGDKTSMTIEWPDGETQSVVVDGSPRLRIEQSSAAASKR